MEEIGPSLGVAVAVGAGVALFALRKRLPARVECWFCGEKRWTPFRDRNSWTCPKCEQPNGFDKDGDYNAPPDSRTQRRVAFAERGRFSTTADGLCRRCNSNQHLKILQLAAFEPTCESKFDTEIRSFKSHLEKIYKLCAKCRNNLKRKLSWEKTLHLKTKIVGNRNVDKNVPKPLDLKAAIEKFLQFALKYITIALLLIVSFDICLHLNLYFSKNVMDSTKNHFRGIYGGAKSVIVDYCDSYAACKTLAESLRANYMNISKELSDATAEFGELRKHYVDWNRLRVIKGQMAMETLSIAGLILRLLSHITRLSFSYRSLCTSLIHGLIVYNAKANVRYLLPLQFILLLILLLNVHKSNQKREETSKKKLKKLVDTSISQSDDDSDDIFNDDSDSERYTSVGSPGVHSASPTLLPGYYNCKYPQYSNFCYPLQKLDASVNSEYNSCYGGSTMNRSFIANGKCYDCELDRSINDLNIGYHSIKNKDNPFAFSTKRYDTSSPNLFGSPSLLQNKFILSPSRLICGTQQSWVAGGYWGVDSPRKVYNAGERSSTSSQSSGFESQSSSVRRGNVNSFPPSRDGSVCSDYEKKSEDYGNVFESHRIVSQRNRGFQPLQSPIFPNMKQNESVFIPNVGFDAALLNGSKRL